LGSSSAAQCLDCKGQFTVDHGGGFRFHQLRCVRCGQATTIGFDELGDLHVRYLKGSERPYTLVFEGEHRYVREHVDVEPLSSEEYYAAVAAAAGNCDCGGTLSFDAPARCPKCGSAQIEEGPPLVCYD
jgi:hypothetical protein